MTWLTAMEYLCHKWPRICSTCRKHIPVHSSFLTYHRVCYYINTASATSGAGTAYPSEHMISPPVFRGSCYSVFSFMCMFFVDRCLSFCPFVLFLLAIVLSVLLAIVLSVLLRFTDYDYPFSIFKLIFLLRQG